MTNVYHQLRTVAVIAIVVSTYAGCFCPCSAEEIKGKPSCDTAARLRTEIWPDMTKYVIPFLNAPESQHADILRDNPVVGKTLMKFTNEFCPALLDCGGNIPGMSQSDVGVHMEMCSGLVKAVKGSK